MGNRSNAVLGGYGPFVSTENTTWQPWQEVITLITLREPLNNIFLADARVQTGLS